MNPVKKHPAMNRLQILLAILLFGAGAAVGGIAGYRYAKSSAVTASAPPRVAVKEDGKTINLAAAGKGAGRTKATSTLLGFMERITKASRAPANNTKRMALWYNAVQTLDPSQIGQTLAEVEAMKDYGDGLRVQLRDMLLSRWGESDPKAALAYAQGIGGATQGSGSAIEKTQAIRSVLSSWGEKDFPAAKAWVEGLPAGPLRNEAMSSLADGLAQKDPAAAASLASSIPGDQGYQALMGAIDAWGAKDADAAIAYVAQLPTGVRQNEALGSLLRTLAVKDPAKAVTLLDQIPDAGIQNDALLQIGYSWGRSDPKAALDWANLQTDSQVKSSILPGVIRSMSEKDSNRALELAQSLPAGEREGVIRSVLFNLSESDPKGAVAYAMNLPSSENRDSMISKLAGQWISNDPAAATQWVNSSSLPQDLKARLLQQK